MFGTPVGSMSNVQIKCFTKERAADWKKDLSTLASRLNSSKPSFLGRAQSRSIFRFGFGQFAPHKIAKPNVREIRVLLCVACMPHPSMWSSLISRQNLIPPTWRLALVPCSECWIQKDEVTTEHAGLYVAVSRYANVYVYSAGEEGHAVNGAREWWPGAVVQCRSMFSFA